jgi:hypothetical protein
MLSICQVKKGDALSLRELINHVSSHMNALQALSLNVPAQDLMLNHLMSAILDETHCEWELLTSSPADIPTTAELITFLEARCMALRVTPEYTVTKYGHYQSTSYNISWKQG